MAVDTSLYDLLQISPEATDAEIKKAYRKQSLANHPDKNPGDEEASARFQDISSAYETLADPDSRAAYDRYGLDGVNGGSHGMGAADMDDIFAQMFGGGMGGMGGMGGRARSKPKRGKDSIIDYEVSLRDLYLGRTAHFHLSKQVICPTCTGSGGKPGTQAKTCVKCQGQGRCTQMRSVGNGMVAQSYATCDECQGEGKKVRDKDRCKRCKGVKTIKEKNKLELKIERGMVDGQTIVFKGENDQEPGVPEPGSIIFKLVLRNDDTNFTIKGLDLQATVHLTLRESLMGFSRTVLVHLDGRHLSVSKTAGEVTRPGSLERIVGEGMPRERDIGERGDLFIRWEVDFPLDGWLQGREEAQRTLSSLLPPPRASIPVEDDTEVTETHLQSASEAEFGRNQPTQHDHDDFWEDETEGPQAGCAGS